MQGESEKKIHHLGALFGHVLGLSSSEADKGALCARRTTRQVIPDSSEERTEEHLENSEESGRFLDLLEGAAPSGHFWRKESKEGRGSHGFQALTGELSDDEEGAKPVREPGKRQNLWD